MQLGEPNNEKNELKLVNSNCCYIGSRLIY
jgi:hypothetical protein